MLVLVVRGVEVLEVVEELEADCSFTGWNCIPFMATEETPTTATAVAVPRSRVLLLTLALAMSDTTPPVPATGFAPIFESAFLDREEPFFCSFLTFISVKTSTLPSYMSNSPNLLG